MTKIMQGGTRLDVGCHDMRTTPLIILLAMFRSRINLDVSRATKTHPSNLFPLPFSVATPAFLLLFQRHVHNRIY
jgi:hypothetical protein